MADVTKAGANIFKRGLDWMKSHKKTTAVVVGAAATTTALNSPVADAIKQKASDAAENEGREALQDEMLDPFTRMWERLYDILNGVWERAWGILEEKIGPMFGFTIADKKKDKEEKKEDVALKEEQREAKVATVAEEIIEEEKIKVKEQEFKASNPGQVRKFLHDARKLFRDTFKSISATAKEWYNAALGRPHEVGRDTAKVDHMMDFFKNKGWTTEQAAGIVASLAIESNLNHEAKGDYSKKTKDYRAYGVAQWHPSRQADFKEKFGHDIRQSTLDEQLEFVHFELTEGKEQSAGNKLKRTMTAKQAGAVVSKYYERPTDKLGEAAKRGEVAALVSAHHEVREQEVRLARNYSDLRTEPPTLTTSGSAAKGKEPGAKPDPKKRPTGLDPVPTPDGVG